MRLAQGIAGDKPFAVVDTEAGRAKHYADKFKFDHGDLRPPFRPDNYIEAIKQADEQGYPVIVVDSMSHEHAGDGGLLDWHEEELTRMAGTDWKKREACNMAAWVKPKMSHKQMMGKLLQVRAHLILCFRAEEKVEMKKVDGKTKIVPKVSATGKNGWIPVCEKNLPYELTVSLLLTADNPGVPLPIKFQEQHKKLFPLDRQITEESGRLIAQWAKGSETAKPENRTNEIVDKLLSAFEGIGMTRGEIEDRLQKPLSDVNEDDIENLRVYYRQMCASLEDDGSQDYTEDDGEPEN